MNKLRSDTWQPNEEIASSIIEKYNNGKSALALCHQYGVADVTITKFLKRNNIKIRNASNARRTNQINENIFDDINEESAYWIGFILSDGNIYYPQKRSKQLNFGLKKSDWEHLEKFKKFIGSNKQLYYNNNAVFLSIYSNKIVDKLEEFNITPRKSKTAKIPVCLKNNRHFWRGMVDGDGWVSWGNNSNPTIGICGTFDIINNFRKFVNKDNKIIKETESGCYSIVFACATSVPICKRLYDHSTIYLDRKLSMAKLICNHYNLCINDSMIAIKEKGDINGK